MRTNLCRLVFFPLYLLGTNIIPSFCSAQEVANSAINKKYKVYHSLRPTTNPHYFSPRGHITLDAYADTVATSFEESNENSCLYDSLGDIDSLVQSNGLYRLKIVDEETNRSVIISVPSCELRRSNFREEISLTIGATGDLLSASYNPLVSPLAPSCHDLPPLSATNDSDDTEKLSFKTIVRYTTAAHAMSLPIVMPQMRPPLGLQWLKRQGKRNSIPQTADTAGSPNSKESPYFDPEKEGKQHESFLKKYWYIILPLMILTFLTSEEPPQKQSKGAAPAVRVAPMSAGTTRQRRSKRGN